MAQAHQGRFISDGLAIDHTPAADVTGGDVIVQENIVAIAKRDIKALALGALAVGGIFDVVKAQEAFATVGANLWWDEDGDPYNGTAGTGAATATPTANTWMGIVLETADATDETVRILLRSSITLTAEKFAINDLSDVGVVAYTAGSLLVGDGDSYEEVALSGPFNLSAAGLLSMDSATAAAAGANQGTATAIADGFTLVTAADGAKGAKLPAAAAGGLCVVKNNAAAALLLYPNTDDAIDALGANNAMTVPAYAVRVLVAYDATTWYSSEIADAELAIAKLAPWTEGNVAVAADALAIPITHRHVSKTTGADAEALTLADGAAGQLLTIDLVVDGGGAGTLTPDTMTGFATIVLDDEGDQVTLQYIDDSVGWVIVGAAGVAAPPAISV